MINFTHQEDDLSFSFNASVFETLKDNYEDKYEYILPEITLDKNLFLSENYGNLSCNQIIKHTIIDKLLIF